jgi:hypothetical protein
MMFATVDYGRVITTPVSAEEPELERPDRHQHQDDEKSREDGDGVITESNRHPERRGDPDRSGRGQPVDIVALTQDRARPEEADAGDDLRGDACGVDSFSESRKESHCGEHARPDGDQAHRLDPGGMTSKLSFDSQRQAEKQGN